jgi:copper oxidase (laccase) domain-containing protein
MEQLGAERSAITAAIGPCIAQQSYEVDSGFRERFLLVDPRNDAFFMASNRADHFRFALEDYVAQRLLRAGVAAVDKLSADTYAAEDKFFSFRRATHKGETDYGRNLSAIVLKG